MLSLAAAISGILDGAANSAAASCSATGHHACQTAQTPCSQLRSNHPGSATDVLDTPQGQGFRDRFVRFVQDFRRATGALSFSQRHQRLSALRVAGGLWSWPMYNGTVLLGDYLNFKAPMLDAFDRFMDLQHQLWRPGMSLLDVGGSLGLQAAYLAAAHGVKATVYEVPFTTDCPNILQSPFRVNFFWGTPPEPSRSYDAVSFMNVLHHAANLTVPLLRQAANIARHFILITEDIDGVTNRNLLHAHDPQGIFRSDAEWKQLFERELPEFALHRSVGLMQRRPCVEGASIPHGPKDYSSTASPSMICLAGPPESFLRFYALERVQSQRLTTGERASHRAHGQTGARAKRTEPTVRVDARRPASCAASPPMAAPAFTEWSPARSVRHVGGCPAWSSERGSTSLPADVASQLTWLADHWLRPFADAGIGADDLLPRAGEDKSQCTSTTPNRLCPLVVVRNGQLLLQVSPKSRLFAQPLAGCHNDTVQGTSARRLQTLLRLLLLVLRDEPDLPDFELRVCVDDFCHGDFEGRPVPWLTMASCATAPTLAAVQWNTQNGRMADLSEWADVLRHRRRWREAQAERWACKESVATWRGSMSESFTTNMPWTTRHKLERRPIESSPWRKAGRFALLAHQCDHPSLFNVFLSGVYRLARKLNDSDPDLLTCVHENTHERRYDRLMSLEAQAARFKYLVHVEGVGGWADRLRHLLLLGTPVIKQDMGVTEWFEPLLVAGRHYIPVSSTLSNLSRAIAWAREHDEAARRIGVEGAALAERILSPEALLFYQRKLVAGYARLWSLKNGRHSTRATPSNVTARFECETRASTRCALVELGSERRVETMRDIWELAVGVPYSASKQSTGGVAC